MMLFNDFDVLATKKMSKAGKWCCFAHIGVL
jgi:hypothetical protein